jgi:hypothetical protein
VVRVKNQPDRSRIHNGRRGKLVAAFRHRLGREEAAEISDWLREIAEENPEEAWLQSTSDRGFTPRPWHELYFRAFDALRYDRFYGAFGGQTPISYMALSAYARDHRITGNNFGRFLQTMYALDRVFLEIEAERLKTDKE